MKEEGKSSYIKEEYTTIGLWSSEYTKHRIIFLTCNEKYRKEFMKKNIISRRKLIS
jgi:hypothetical protein